MIIKNIIKNEYVFALFTKSITILTGIFSNIFLTRYLSVKLKGDYTYINTIINIFMCILCLGIYQTYMYQRRTKGIKILQQYINIFVFQFAFYLIIAFFVVENVSNYQLKLAIIALPIEILNHQLMMVCLVEKYSLRQKTIIFSHIIYLIMTIILYLYSPRNLIFPIIILLIKDIFCILTCIIQMNNWHENHLVDFNFLKLILPGGFLMMLATLMLTLNYKVDVIMLNKYTNNTQIGLYAIGVGLAEYAWIIPDAFKEVLFGKTAKGNANKDIKLSIIINMIILLPIILALYFMGGIIIKIIYGFEFIEARNVTKILSLGIPVMIFFKILGTVYLAKGRYLFYTISLGTCVAVNIIFNSFLIPQYGINGAAIASVFSYNLCGLIFLFKYIFDNKKITEKMEV